MKMKHAIVREFGPDCICYCDTDSVVVSFDKLDPAFNQAIENAYDIYQWQLRTGRDASKSFDILQNMLTTNQYVRRLEQIKVLDLCNLHSGAQVPLIDEDRLGAAKIEKFVIKGMFAAPKSYMLDYFADGKIKHVIKSKGV